MVIDSQRNRLLQALADSCAQKGYPATTVADIVDAAGVSRATFYEFFKDKDDCMVAAANALLADVITAATTAYSPDKPLFNVVRDAVAAILALMASQPSFAYLAFVEGRTLPQTHEVYRSGVRVLISLLDQVRIDSPSNASARSSAARAAVGGAEALIRRKIVAGRTDEVPGLLPEIVYGTLVVFLGRAEALRQSELARKHPPVPA